MILKLLDAQSILGNRDVTHASDLLLQALKWHEASIQDQHPLFSVQHSNYAIAYLNAARHLCRDSILEQKTR